MCSNNSGFDKNGKNDRGFELKKKNQQAKPLDCG